MFDPEVNEAVEEFSEELAKQFPEVGVIIEMLKAGDIERDEAIGRLMDIVAQQGIGEDITRVAEGAFAALKAQSNQMVPVPTGLMPPLVYKGGDKNLPMMNPLLEAAISERAQFDGDIPELRTGPKLPHIMPAVPVETDARDLVTVGQQLQAASEIVQAEIDEASEEYIKARNLIVEKMLSENEDMDPGTALTYVKERPWLVSAAPADGVPGYETGKLPAARDVGAPPGSHLAAMTPEARRESAYKALSTTQGRRSALKVITELVQVGLEGNGYPMATRPFGKADSVPVYAEYKFQISGAKSTQSNFSFIDMTARSLCRQITEQLNEVEVPRPVLEVFPINTVDIRKVGWGARVVPA